MADLIKALNLTSNLLANLDNSSTSNGNSTGSINSTLTLISSSESVSNGTASSLSGNSTAALVNGTASDKLELGSFDLPSNYSILINKLEQLALGLDAALGGNITIDRQEVEINLSGDVTASNVADVADDLLFSDVIPAARAPPPHIAHGSRVFTGDDADEYAHVVSDIWIGVILTLLIVFIIFFICACFLYHKFQQWKNSYRANHSEPSIEICRRCPPDYEVESLPSYTIVSGLPTYDDALEEFRKAGIILTPAVVPIIKIFESQNDNGAKESTVAYNLVEAGNAVGPNDTNADNISLSSATCNCGGIGGGVVNLLPAAVAAGGGAGNASAGNSPTSVLPSYTAATAATVTAGPMTSQIIELSPEHLAALSQKRLSMQISFNNSVRGTTRRTHLRHQLLRSRAVGNTAGMGPIDTTLTANSNNSGGGGSGVGHPRESHTLPAIHRSSSSLSLTNERQLLDQRLRHLHHRGSLY